MTNQIATYYQFLNQSEIIMECTKCMRICLFYKMYCLNMLKCEILVPQRCCFPASLCGWCRLCEQLTHHVRKDAIFSTKI